MALTPFPSSVGWDKIRTHDLPIVNLVCYPLDQAFAQLLMKLWWRTWNWTCNFLLIPCNVFPKVKEVLKLIWRNQMTKSFHLILFQKLLSKVLCYNFCFGKMITELHKIYRVEFNKNDCKFHKFLNQNFNEFVEF